MNLKLSNEPLSGLPRRDRRQEDEGQARRLPATQDPPGQEPADQHRAQGQRVFKRDNLVVILDGFRLWLP